jgi:hypothetical protein
MDDGWIFLPGDRDERAEPLREAEVSAGVEGLAGRVPDGAGANVVRVGYDPALAAWLPANDEVHDG